MRFFLISDNVDTLTGMRLAGIEGVIVHEADEVNAALDKAVADENIAIILMTQKLIELCEKKVLDLKLKQEKTLIVEIPDRHLTSQITDSINRYVREAIGIKL